RSRRPAVKVDAVRRNSERAMGDPEAPGAVPPAGHQELDRKELWDQLSRAVTLRGNQDQVLWRIFAAFSAGKALLLVALFRAGAMPASRTVIFVTAGGGLGLSGTLMCIQRSAPA